MEFSFLQKLLLSVTVLLVPISFKVQFEYGQRGVFIHGESMINISCVVMTQTCGMVLRF